MMDNSVEAGATRRGHEIGMLRKPNHNFICIVCPVCGAKRWVEESNTHKPGYTGACRKCFCERYFKYDKAPNWQGGRSINTKGYVQIKLLPSDFFYPMAMAHDYILEHRLVMAKHLGRCLQAWEIVHHKNGVLTDNRLSNLEITLRGSHIHEHSKGYRDGYKAGYEAGRQEALKLVANKVAV